MNLDNNNINPAFNASDMDQEIDEARFIPWNYERDDPALTKLFRDVEQLIHEFVEENYIEGGEKQVRQYVAGHVCHEILNEVKGKMITFTAKKNVHAYNLYIKEELKKHNQRSKKKSSFKDLEKMAEIRASYGDIKEKQTPQYDRLARSAQEESVDIKTLAMNVKQTSYQKDWKALKENLRFFQENYRTHIILIAATDTKYDTIYKPSLVVNSDISGHAVDLIHDEMPGISLPGILNSAVIRNGIFAAQEKMSKKRKRNANSKGISAYTYSSVSANSPAVRASSPAHAPSLADAPFPADVPSPARGQTVSASPVSEYEEINAGNDSDSGDTSFVPLRRVLRSSAAVAASPPPSASRSASPCDPPSAFPAVAPSAVVAAATAAAASVSASVFINNNTTTNATTTVLSLANVTPRNGKTLSRDEYLTFIRAKGTESYRSVAKANPRNGKYKKTPWIDVFKKPDKCDVVLEGWPDSIPAPINTGGTFAIKALRIQDVATIAKGLDNHTIRFAKK